MGRKKLTSRLVIFVANKFTRMNSSFNYNFKLLMCIKETDGRPTTCNLVNRTKPKTEK